VVARASGKRRRYEESKVAYYGLALR
jgi:hypothetical protein